MENAVAAFIRGNWKNTIRECKQDAGTLIALPRPYTVPSPADRFEEMYYWDTYFTNVGLIASGLPDVARNNVENIASMIRKYGYMPNGNRTFYLGRSQPPFFTKMIRDVYEIVKDRVWLAGMYDAAKTEYRFWQTERITGCGLNHYSGTIADEDALRRKANGIAKRMKMPEPTDMESIARLGHSAESFCESGWDCNSRFDLRAHEFAPIELGSLLFGMENDLAYFADELGNGEGNMFREAAEQRQTLYRRLCYDEDVGMFCDYDIANQKKSDIVSVANFYPLWLGLTTKEEAARTVKLLSKLEYEHGVAATESRDGILGLQWDYPHGWGCLQHITVAALDNYGYRADAARIARKYCATVEAIFRKTGNLWEKYNVVTGEIANAEYAAPTMMGWSAGSYLFCLERQ